MDWERSLNKLSAEEAWSKFYDNLCKAIDMFVPKTQPNIDKRKKVWMNKAAMTLGKKKYESWKRYTETGDYLDYVRAARDRDNLTYMTRNLCRYFVHNLARNIKANSKSIFALF